MYHEKCVLLWVKETIGMNRLMKSVLIVFVMLGLIMSAVSPVWAKKSSDESRRAGKITGRSVVAGAASFFVWPGIGQAVNDNKGKKVATHAVLGLLPPYRFWSAYDAVVDRKGGYLEGNI
jgi:hypothetical protein